MRTLRTTWPVYLISRIKRGQWLVSERYAEDMAPFVADLLLGKTPGSPSLDDIRILASEDGEHFSPESDNGARDYVAIVPICGTMLKYGTLCTAGTIDVAESLQRLAVKTDCSAVVLDIDSGGGCTDSIPCLVDAIDSCHRNGKPVVASVDFCASAAYWVASYCDHIMAQNTLSSEIGSIGAYATFVDDRGANEKAGLKFHYIYPPESADKNLMYRNALDGDFEMLASRVSDLAVRFQNTVKRNRKKLRMDVDGLLTGKMFCAEDALSAGLIDSIGNLSEAVRMAMDLAEIRKFNQ